MPLLFPRSKLSVATGVPDVKFMSRKDVPNAVDPAVAAIEEAVPIEADTIPIFDPELPTQLNAPDIVFVLPIGNDT